MYIDQLQREQVLKDYQIDVIRGFSPEFGNEFEFAGIHLERMRFSPNQRIDFSNIHLNVIDANDFLRLNLFSLFLEVFDFLQYNKTFEREQDLQDIKTITGASNTDSAAMLIDVTNYVNDPRYRDLTQKLLDAYEKETLTNAQINDFLNSQKL